MRKFAWITMPNPACWLQTATPTSPIYMIIIPVWLMYIHVKKHFHRNRHYLNLLKHGMCPKIFILLIYLFIYQAVQCFHMFLRPFNNYIIFFLQLLLSFQSSSINPFSPISPLIPSAQVSLGLPRFLLPGGRHFITSFGSLPSSILWTCPYHWSCLVLISSKRDLFTFIFCLIILFLILSFLEIIYIYFLFIYFIFGA